MKRIQFDAFFDNVLEQIKESSDSGQKEYARTEENVFANFDRVGGCLNISREKALMVYLLKHIDGISSYIEGHRSQREDVSGRIKDAIVYLFLLWAMVDGDSSFASVKNRVESML